MFVTKLNIIQHVMEILDLEKKGQKLFIYLGINYVSNRIHTKHNT